MPINSLPPFSILPGTATTAPLTQGPQIFAAGAQGDARFLVEASRGERFPLAQREDGSVISATWSDRGRGLPEDVFFNVEDPEKVLEFKLEVEENGTAGLLHFFLTPEETFLFEIDTQRQTDRGPAMKKGAGSILLTWLATQAALRGVLFAVTGIENFKVADIIVKQGLIAAKSGRVEFYHSPREGRYTCLNKFSLNNASALRSYENARLEYPQKFLVISGEPEPRLTRSVRFTRLPRGKA